MENQVRKLVLADLACVESVMLSQQQWEVLKFIEREGYDVPSSSIGIHFGFSPQHTAMLTAALFHKGYVDRLRGTSPSGGNEYSFRLRVGLAGGG